MRHLGFGWKTVDISWSKDYKTYSVDDLTNRLNDIIKLEGKGQWEIPPHPPVDTPSRTHTVALGTRTADVDYLDQKYVGDERDLRKKAKRLLRERESRGEGSVPSACQPPRRPELSELVGLRIEVLTPVKVTPVKVNGDVEDDDDGVDNNVDDGVDDDDVVTNSITCKQQASASTAKATKKKRKKDDPLIWWPCKVLYVENEVKRLVMVTWDPLADVQGWENGGEGTVKLGKNKWKGEVKDAWRMEYIDSDGDSDSD